MEAENKDQSGQKSKSWIEKLIESIAGNAEIIKNLVALLANPLIISSLTVAFVCWIFQSKEDSGELSSDSRQLRAELDKIRRKYKKLRKKLKKGPRNNYQNPPQKPHPLAGGREGSFGAYFFN
jgi:hypothetical protein